MAPAVLPTPCDEQKRSAFRQRLRGVDPERFIFVDEPSTNVALTPRYARAPKGERAHGKAPRNWGKNVTLISSITPEGMGASVNIEGSSDTQSFGLYIREVLAPRLRPSQIVLMDNLSVHRSGWVSNLIEEKGCQLWFREGSLRAGSCCNIRPWLTRRVPAPPTDPSFGSPWENQKDLGVPSGGSGLIRTRSTSALGRSLPTKR